LDTRDIDGCDKSGSVGIIDEKMNILYFGLEISSWPKPAAKINTEFMEEGTEEE
jgi:hypothetical protein